MAALLRRVEDLSAGRARDRTEARAMATRMGSDAAALQAAESRLCADLEAARRQVETSHALAEAHAGELAALQKAHAALEATSRRLEAEADGARASLEQTAVRLETGARERSDLQAAAARDREACYLANAEAVKCQSRASKACLDAEAARAREAAALERARASEERESNVSQSAAAASGRAKAAAGEAHAWRTAARRWALCARVQRTTSAETAARRRGFERWRAHILATSLALARDAALSAAAAASDVRRAHVVGTSLRKMARAKVWRAWALWRRVRAVSSAAEAMQTAQAESAAEARRSAAAAMTAALAAAEEVHAAAQAARGEARDIRLESILAENQSLATRAASLVSESRPS
jgi:hypothetical protein